jgi:hypothetical protein
MQSALAAEAASAEQVNLSAPHVVAKAAPEQVHGV